MSNSPSNINDAANSVAAPSGFQLIIERGVSRFPQRPIGSGRFLIGAGSNCQLQLGGEIPLLHSIILPEKDQLWIDAVAPHPPLVVNGQVMRDGPLHRGDIVEIGEFVFCVDFVEGAVEPAVPAPAAAIPAEERTAAELLTLLEEDLTGLSEFETGQQERLASLRNAALMQNAVSQLDWKDDPRASILRMLGELHERALALDQREAALNEHARKLTQSQEELRRQLEQLCSQARSESASQANNDVRKSA
ncbi:FHA domain-containing protein [Planctomicrobium sp. SH661]|uniref:FHA domain-containing protein n=1 Tax=Planctomicrobium sp. SH661 TaxID=3448124 RepID=UPI003F5B01D1